jgi:hypothetical protein
MAFVTVCSFRGNWVSHSHEPPDRDEYDAVVHLYLHVRCAVWDHGLLWFLDLYMVSKKSLS